MKTKLMLLAIGVALLAGCERKHGVDGFNPITSKAEPLPTAVYPAACPMSNCGVTNTIIASDNQTFTFDTTIANTELWILYICPGNVQPTSPQKCLEERNNSGPFMKITSTGVLITGAKSAGYVNFQAWREKEAD